jgi:predicted phosphoribosyltransferase
MPEKTVFDNIHDLPQLRDHIRVFRDRPEAGSILATMLEDFRGSNALILAIPAGGVPVAATLSDVLELPMDVCVVSKILLPWTTEAGFGAVAFDGSVWLNREYIDYYNLNPEQITVATEEARQKVKRRVRRFRGDRPWPTLKGRPVIVVDDGLASGATLQAGLAALRRTGADHLIIAVPTSHRHSAEILAARADELYCANLRAGPRFAVADAYQHWSDVSEDEAIALTRKS